MVDNDGYGYRACSDEASDFVCWTEEGPTKVMGVVEDGDRPCASRHKDNVEGLIELCHFFVGICLKVHRASEAGDVPVAGLVHRRHKTNKLIYQIKILLRNSYWISDAFLFL